MKVRKNGYKTTIELQSLELGLVNKGLSFLPGAENITSQGRKTRKSLSMADLLLINKGLELLMDVLARKVKCDKSNRKRHSAHRNIVINMSRKLETAINNNGLGPPEWGCNA